MACKSETTQKDAFLAMQKASCDGDIPGFFRYVDRTALKKNLTKRVIDDHLERRNKYAEAVIEANSDEVIDDAMDQWEDSVKRGQDSDFCQAYGVEWNGFDWVMWTTPTGKPKRGRFERAGKSWILVTMEDR